MLSHGNVISATGNVSFPYAPGKFLMNEDVQEVRLSCLPPLLPAPSPTLL